MTVENRTPGVDRPSSPLLVVLAWTVVGVPALWGISMTARTAMKLFQPQAAQTTAAPASSPMPTRNP